MLFIFIVKLSVECKRESEGLTDVEADDEEQENCRKHYLQIQIKL